MLVRIAIAAVCLVLILSAVIYRTRVAQEEARAAEASSEFNKNQDELRQILSERRPEAARYMPPPAFDDEGTESPAVVTLAEYLKIPDRTNHVGVKIIVGAWGEETGRSTLGGVETTMYRWTNPDGSMMSVMFSNDRLVSKNQYGLK